MTNEPWELSQSEKEKYFGDLGRDLISPSLISCMQCSWFLCRQLLTPPHSEPLPSGVAKREDLSDNSHLLEHHRSSLTFSYNTNSSGNRQKHRYGHTKKRDDDTVEPRPRSMQNMQMFPVKAHQLEPLVSDRDNFLGWQLWSFSLYSTSSKRLSWENHFWSLCWMYVLASQHSSSTQSMHEKNV